MGQHEQPMPAGRRRIALATGVAITALLIVLATASTSGSGRHGSFIPLGATAADAVQAVEDQLMQECLSLEQATGLLSSALTKAGIGPDDYTVRTDGGVQSKSASSTWFSSTSPRDATRTPAWVATRRVTGSSTSPDPEHSRLRRRSGRRRRKLAGSRLAVGTCLGTADRHMAVQRGSLRRQQASSPARRGTSSY